MSSAIFAIFAQFREVILDLFFIKVRDLIAVIKRNLKRIELTLTVTDGLTTPTTLEGICNALRFVFNQAHDEAAYPER
jgi:hypothetical protein